MPMPSTGKLNGRTSRGLKHGLRAHSRSITVEAWLASSHLTPLALAPVIKDATASAGSPPNGTSNVPILSIYREDLRQ